MSTVPLFTSAAEHDPANLSVECWYRNRIFYSIQVSNLANVRDLEGNRIKGLQYRAFGALEHRILISPYGTKKVLVPAARLVASTYWLPENGPYRYIKYVDEDKSNAVFTNLTPVEFPGNQNSPTLTFESRSPHY